MKGSLAAGRNKCLGHFDDPCPRVLFHKRIKKKVILQISKESVHKSAIIIPTAIVAITALNERTAVAAVHFLAIIFPFARRISHGLATNGWT